jgi:serine/threonine protein kinase
LGDNIAATFRAITLDTPIAPSQINPSIPKALSDLIVKTLSKNPDERFQTGAAMTDALKTCLELKELTEVPKEETKERKMPVGLFFIIGFMILGIFGGIYYFIGPYKDQPKSITEPKEAISQPEYSVLNVTSSPTGAQVYINNSYNGQTPLNLKIPFGKHEVRLNLPDYYDWEAQLQLNEAGETPLFVRLIPME